MKVVIRIFSLMGFLLLFSCKQRPTIFDTVSKLCEMCNTKEYAVLNAAENGNVEELKAYIDQGGDPMLRCHNPRVKFGRWDELYFKVAKSDSYELLNYYLTLPISNQIKNELLQFEMIRENLNMCKLLIKNGAHLSWDGDAFRCATRNHLRHYALLGQLNYDFNWQDLENNGNTLLIETSTCKSLRNNPELIKVLQFLIDQGARTDLKNNDGKTAYDLAVDPKVKEFLAKYE